MRYLPLICLISKTITCLSTQGQVNVVTVNGAENLSSPSAVCTQMGMQPYFLQAQDVNTVLASMKAAGVQRANIAGWNDEKIDMVIGTSAGEVTPLDHNNKTNSVLCLSGGASASTTVSNTGPSRPAETPCSSAGSPVAPGPVRPSCPAVPAAGCCAVEKECKAPCVEIKGNVCPTVCCKPTKCVVKRRPTPCDSPCVANYPHKKVYVIDELSLFCGPFIRIVETRCRPFARDTIWTISKALPYHIGQIGVPSMLRSAEYLHKILCEARSKFSACGCVCLFIDHFNNVFIAVGDDYYQVIPNGQCMPCRPFPNPWGPFPRGPGPVIPGMPFPGFCPPRCPPMCPPMCPPAGRNCSPCAPKVKCAPKNGTDGCGKPCPPCFTFCKISCERMVQIRRRGLYAVLFSTHLELY
ncbi:hypothetical protein NEMIN01_2227 [Nematocida minor]|uniref:uncharacterized protein n=1 Tax=Nematocida minor TaxID=1912983 RepID=UPI00221EDB14|nr:uncharacterized protein NEMIN01_2227 [Nematocida minor]KAI5192804.1 hypothetical protein NEMIN01_2227 [Nematocida minor]